MPRLPSLLSLIHPVWQRDMPACVCVAVPVCAGQVLAEVGPDTAGVPRQKDGWRLQMTAG